MRVQLLYFPGCPHVEAARRALNEALASVDDRPDVEEIDVTDPATPGELRSWGSPTILIDGHDVEGAESTTSCCRLYPGSEQKGVPPLATLQAALQKGARRDAGS